MEVVWRRCGGGVEVVWRWCGRGVEEGTSIETLGSAPQRYDFICQSLHIKNRNIFWEAIWDLANNTAQLSNYGIEGVYGNAIYTRMQPGKVYLFKISSTGQIYPETVEAY